MFHDVDQLEVEVEAGVGESVLFVLEDVVKVLETLVAPVVEVTDTGREGASGVG